MVKRMAICIHDIARLDLCLRSKNQSKLTSLAYLPEHCERLPSRQKLTEASPLSKPKKRRFPERPLPVSKYWSCSMQGINHLPQKKVGNREHFYSS